MNVGEGLPTALEARGRWVQCPAVVSRVVGSQPDVTGLFSWVKRAGGQWATYTQGGSEHHLPWGQRSSEAWRLQVTGQGQDVPLIQAVAAGRL